MERDQNVTSSSSYGVEDGFLFFAFYMPVLNFVNVKLFVILVSIYSLIRRKKVFVFFFKQQNTNFSY